jgi:hypothetical protein
MEGGRGTPASAGTAHSRPAGAPATPPPPRPGRSFGARLKLIGIGLLALPFVILALTEVVHRLQHGHFFLPLTYHWDLETREVEERGSRLRAVRPRLTNYTLLPFKIERLEGDGMLWFRELRYRHHVERRGSPSAPWRLLHREDLVYERQGRPPHLRTIGPWATIYLAWHPVQDAGGADVVLHSGEEVRFVLYTMIDSEEKSPNQKIIRSPAFKL